MRIVIDMQGAQTESQYRGIGRYTRSLALSIVKNRGEHEIILALNGLFTDTIDILRGAFDGLLPQDNIRVWYAPSPVRACSIANRWRIGIAERLRESFLLSLQPDVVLLSSLFEGYGDDAVTSIGAFAPGLSTAVILYDLIPLIHSSTYLKPNLSYRDFYLSKLEELKKAHAWFSISECTTREACEHLQLERNAVTDISAACDPVFKPLDISSREQKELQQHFGIDRPFALYSGGADTRKNLPRLIRVFAKLDPALRKQFQLVLVGKIDQDYKDSFTKLAKNCGLAAADMVFTGSISDLQLCQFYNLCHAYVFPSLHEGFGLPVLEAMSCGAPVIASNASCLPEVVGIDEALFDPLDDDDMMAKLTRVLSDRAFREKLIAHGETQVRKYSWDQTGIKALAAMERLVTASGSRPAGNNDTAALIASVAAAGAGFSDEDLQQCAASIALNHPVPRQKTAFVDISELAQRDAATGVQRVTRSILCQLLANPPEGFRVEPVYATTDVPGYQSARRFTAKLLNAPQVEDDELIDPRAGDLFLGLDLQHHTTRIQSPYLQALRSRGVAVYFVVYDLLPIQFPQYWPSMHPVHSEWLRVVVQFDGVICISRTVAHELEEWLAVHGPKRQRPLRIGWFHLGADIDNSVPSRGLPADADQVLSRLASRPTFLAVGTIEPRKGQALALSAFEKLWAAGLDVNLVLVGKQGWLVEQLVDRLRQHPELGRRLFWLEGITDEYLAKVYAASTCLISPSEGEGFGLPLIEAAQLGLPIIATDIPVFREVAGDFATYFSGQDPESLVQVVKDWLTRHRQGQTPKVAEMPWLTWAESAEQLKTVICDGNWLTSWPDNTDQITPA